MLPTGNAQTLSVTFTPTDTASYGTVTASVSINVVRASLTVSASNAGRTYGGSNPAFTGTLTGVQNGDNITASYSCGASSSSPVGQYAIVPTLTDPDGKLSNYSVTLNNAALTVSPASLTVTADNKNRAYGASNPAFTGTVNGVQNGDNITAIFNCSATPTSPVGTYPIVPSLNDPGSSLGNYNVTLNNGTLIVSQARALVTLNPAALTQTYDGLPKVVTADTTPPGLAVTLTYSGNLTPPTSAGTYSVVATVNDPNYVGSTTGSLTVNPAPLTVSGFTATSKPYDGASTATLNRADAKLNGILSADTGNVTLVTSGATGIFADKNIGTAKLVMISGLTLSGSAAANYALVQPTTTASITPATLTYVADTAGRAYGAANPPFTGGVTGFVGADTQANGTTGTLLFSSPASVTSAVGTYAINGSGLTANNGNYVFVQASGNAMALAVNAAILTITANNASKNYGAALPTFTASYSGFVNGDTATSLTSPVNLSSIATAGSAVGTYPITASGAASLNYAITLVPGTLTVAPAALSIAADNKAKAYGAALPAFTATYTGFVDGDTASSLTSPVNLSSTATAGSAVGNYPITASGAASPNYAITLVPGSLTIAPAALTISADNKSKAYGVALPTLTASYTGFVNGDAAASLTTPPNVTTAATASSPAGTYAITASGAVDANYNISYVPGTLTVNPVGLTITVDSKSKSYGAALPAFTASYSGFANGDSASSLTTPVTLNSTASAGSAVGTYPITASGATSPNYVITFASGSLSVTPAALTVTADNKSKVYGAALPAFTASYSGFVNGDTAASLTTPPNVTTAATASSPAGTYAITASGAVDANYMITYAPGTLTVNAVGLTITANSASKSYGAPLPALLVTYSGFVNGDTAASLTTPPNVTTAATASSPAGTYAITASGAVDANYTVSYVPGTLTVNAVGLTISADSKSKAYGAALPTFTASYSGSVNGDTATSLTTPPNLGSTATAGSAVGTYPITVSGATSPNYAITFAPGTLSVAPASLTITADNKTKAYGAALPIFTASYSGFVNGDTASSLTAPVNLSSTGSAASGVGTYPITGSGATSPNYAIAFAPGTLMVTPASLTIAADNKSKAYGAALPAFTATYSGFVNGDTASSLATSVNLTSSATPTSTAGIYPITASGATSPNYAITFAPGTLTVAPASLAITADNKTKTYGAALPTFTATYSGFVNGDTDSSLTTPISLSSTATAGSAVGTYPITVSGAGSANYAITFTPGTLTVTPAPLTITADNKTKAYGAALPTFTASYSGFVNGDTASSLATSVNLTSTAIPSSAVGTYPITTSGAASANYTIAFAPGTLTVTPGALTVTADDKTRAFGTTNPILTATISGFVNGETTPTSGVAGTPALSTTADTNSPPGSYPIVAAQGSLTAANYTFNFVNGTLTVTGVAPLITQQPPSQTVNPGDTATFFVMADGSQPLSYQWLFDGAPLSGATTATLTLTNVSTNQAGVYAVTVSNVVGTVTSSNAVLTVNPAVAPPTLSSPKLTGHTFSVSVRTTKGRNHHLEFTDSLGQPKWTEVDMQPGTGGDVTLQDANASGAARYYRVRVE